MIAREAVRARILELVDKVDRDHEAILQALKQAAKLDEGQPTWRPANVPQRAPQRPPLPTVRRQPI